MELTAQRRGAAESFRQLTATLFLGRNGDTPRRILITSAVQMEGKTSIATNLAIALAEQRQRVLLLDCDLHSPKLHTAFSLALGPGLAETILGEGFPSDHLRPTGISGLFVMTAGNDRQAPGLVIAHPRFRAFVEDMLHDFHVIIIDAPPVLAVSDPAVLTMSSDAVLMVVRAGLVTAGDAGEALRTLALVGAPVIGAVLNDPDGMVRHYGGGYAYAYRYN